METKEYLNAVEQLALMMGAAGYYFWISSDDDSGEEVSDEDYEFVLETQTGELIGSRAPITVSFRRDMRGLHLLDMRPARGKEDPSDEDGVLYINLTAEQAFKIIKEFFEAEKAQ